MFYKFIKLVNGEDIIVQTDDKCDSFNDKEFISVVDPVIIDSIRIPRGPIIIETYIMQPWIKMAVSDVIQIPTKNIIVAVDMKESAKEQYLQYMVKFNSRQDEPSVNLDDLEENDESEESFEDILQSLNTDSEEEEDVGKYRTKFGRTIH